MDGGIRLAQQRIYVHAAPELVYQYVSSLGPDARVIERGENELVAEFVTRVGRWRVRTLERVGLEPSERITYEQLRPVVSAQGAEEEFIFHRLANGGCELHYRGLLHPRWGPAGWALTRWLLKPLWDSVIRRHMQELKAGAEARALRSRMFPQPRPQGPLP